MAQVTTARQPAQLRIALQIERFLPGKGGAEGYARTLAAGLAAAGQEVTVIAGEGSDPPAGVRLHLVPLIRHPKSLRALLYAVGSARAARSGGYDVVHAMGKSLGMNILNPHGGVEEVWLARELRSHRGFLARSSWAARRYLSPRHHVLKEVLRRQYADPRVLRYVALSAGIREAMVRIHGVERSRIVLLPNSVDPERFRPPGDAGEKAELRRKLGLPAEKLVLLFVGHNFRLKGLAPLLSVLGRLRAEAPPLSLVVLGRGDVERYRRLARKFGCPDLADFRGAVGHLEEWYRSADGYLAPTFYDACSLALQEAMASGLPALASRHDGSAEVITDGVDGVLLQEPDDLQTFAEGLRLFFNPEWRARTGEAARETILLLPRPEPAAAMLEIYRDALRDCRLPK
jgi:UDP-glucose:(heptosyl)LPS alpha-1,3-glucosyltransferase